MHLGSIQFSRSIVGFREDVAGVKTLHLLGKFDLKGKFRFFKAATPFLFEQKNERLQPFLKCSRSDM